jgi:hypothetical protein
MADRRCTLAVVVFCLLFGSVVALRGQERSWDIQPAGQETAIPIEGAGAFGNIPPHPTPEGPASTLDPQTFASLQEAARHNPHAEIPDQLVPLVLPRASQGAGSEAGKASGEGVAVITGEGNTLRSFAGLEYASSFNTDGLFRPPDTTLGKSATRVLEGTNSALSLFTPTGSVLATKSLNDFFAADPTTEGILFDPRVIYDRLGPNQRLFVVSLQRNNALNVRTASIYLAVSRVANPDNLEPSSWCRYKIDSVLDRDKAVPTWADFPMVGVGADAFLISNDQFEFPANPTTPVYTYKYGILRVVRKDLLTNNATACPQYSGSIFLMPKVLDGTTGTDQALGHVQPAIHYTAPSSFQGTTNPVYMVSTIVPPAKTYRIWRVRNAASGAPTVQVLERDAASEYAMPPAAVQPAGGAATLSAKDPRIMQVVAIGDTIWAIHVTACQQARSPITTSITKPCIRALKFFVSASGDTLASQFQEDVTFASPDPDLDLGYYMPGLAVTSAFQTAVVFLASSPSLYVSGAWTTKYGGDAIYSPASVFLAGSCAKSSSAKKLGDYVGAQTNPGDLSSFWLAAEGAIVSGSTCQWKTQILQGTP